MGRDESERVKQVNGVRSADRADQARQRCGLGRGRSMLAVAKILSLTPNLVKLWQTSKISKVVPEFCFRKFDIIHIMF